jgi:protein-disulfide isomerase
MTTQGHPEHERLMAWHDGELAGAEEADVRAHVEGCADCRQFVQGMRAVGKRLAGWQVEPATLKPPAARPVLRRPIVWIAAAAAAVLVAAAIVLPRVMRSEESEGALQANARPPARPSGGSVRVEIFGDWLCSSCVNMIPALARMAQEINDAGPRSVVLAWRDFPLDSACNPHISRTVHAGACDAALAVRLAREQGDGDALIASYHAGTAGSPYQELKSRLAKMDANPALVIAYERARADLSRDIADGHARNVTMTPFVFVNGESIAGSDGATVAAVRSAVETAMRNRASQPGRNRRGGYGDPRR